jgi:hypothetical protein
VFAVDEYQDADGCTTQETYTEGIRQVNANLIKQHDYFVEAIEQSDLRMRQIDDRVDDKLDKFQ